MKRVLITGASGGIGSAMAEEFDREGYELVLHCHKNIEKLNDLKERLSNEPVLVSGDLSTEEGVNSVIEQVGDIDVLINNAGITRDGLLLTMKPESFDAVIAANLRSVYLMSRAVLRGMTKRRWGRIINLSSVSGIYGNAGQTNYAASKAGIIGFSKSLAKEVASRNVTVNCIAPGMIETEMTAAIPEKAKGALLSEIPMKRMGRPEEIAYIASFLASEKASYITGSVIEADGGM
ncbi:MAG TPA: 3-oxoacyl-[acyl-carrier-protein] reductase [Lachnospiraceae bacterium]|nr:3-oxoacyl-[acyl-carrier-protein] reductase [Lachnospiraceae bacterium]MDD7664249.1 3-oxoacyl-[acyl-carrier-protein] reductase [Lachnospiraceae bacterium]MDY4164453.1 3-oxoacyl-[acyl-carrier-protein] reductase [Lachnospiraceae bacterium]HAP03177.1 3-oxoacyl-[acyl-carrier-protein] reductase [Lachnospiraceae bacterium]